jgi:hypothetical protein
VLWPPFPPLTRLSLHTHTHKHTYTHSVQPLYPSYQDDAEAMMIASDKQASQLWSTYLPHLDEGNLLNERKPIIKLPSTIQPSELQTISSEKGIKMINNEKMASSSSKATIMTSQKGEELGDGNTSTDELKKEVGKRRLLPPESPSSFSLTDSSKKKAKEQEEDILPSKTQLGTFSFEGW